MFIESPFGNELLVAWGFKKVLRLKKLHGFQIPLQSNPATIGRIDSYNSWKFNTIIENI